MEYKRKAIIKEILSRLKKNLRISAVRGKPFMTFNYPEVAVFEGEEKVSNPKPGIYSKILPISMELWDKVSTNDIGYEVGNVWLEKTAKALEMDDRFSNLTVRYYQTSNSIYLTRDGEVAIVMNYNFEYVDPFEGTTRTHLGG